LKPHSVREHRCGYRIIADGQEKVADLLPATWQGTIIDNAAKWSTERAKKKRNSPHSDHRTNCVSYTHQLYTTETLINGRFLRLSDRAKNPTEPAGICASCWVWDGARSWQDRSHGDWRAAGCCCQRWTDVVGRLSFPPSRAMERKNRVELFLTPATLLHVVMDS
jgi:hypothetical protein